MTDMTGSAQTTAAVSNLYEQKRIRIPKRGPLFEYQSPDAPQPMGVDQFVLSIDPVSLRAVASSFSVRGLPTFAALMCLLGGSVPFAIVLKEISRKGFSGTDFFILALLGGFSLVMGLLACALVVWDMSKPYLYPLLFNRRAGRVVQMQGRKRVEAKWSDLVPFIERVNSASSAGAGTVFHLHLVKLSLGGGAAELDFIVRVSLGSPQACAMAFEYIKCYMQGDLQKLPDTTLIPSIRRPFLKEFRNGMVAGVFNDVSWAKRSTVGLLVTLVFLPLLVLLTYPIVALNLLGSRFGWIPKFPIDVLADAEYVQGRDGSLPSELLARIHSDPPLEPRERTFYVVVLVVVTGVWIWFTGVLIHFFAGLFGSL